ncbi:hypothetical protein Sjap_019088 [Stephania japonica]|uniref:Uncharacterized protein n=1 Tax=Stephania japonica TaxID=461633 RepID=A0AAP0HZD7_9MAGN
MYLSASFCSTSIYTWDNANFKRTEDNIRSHIFKEIGFEETILEPRTTTDDAQVALVS